jgi:hypothetical protein
MDVGSRRQLRRKTAWRHVLAMTLLLAVVGGAGERLREDGVAPVSAAAPRPSRVSTEQVHCQAPWLVAGSIEPNAIVETLMAAPVCMATLMVRKEWPLDGGARAVTPRSMARITARPGPPRPP